MEEPTPQNWRRFARIRPNRKVMRKRARKIESITVKHAHTFIVRRWDNVKDVRRYTLSWLILMLLLIGISGLQTMAFQQSYTKVAQASGGTYAEGVTGPLDTINPLFATTNAEKSASKLIFSSLLSYDRYNRLRGELASDWTMSTDGTTYTVTLRPNIEWHDGAPITADDVVYTVNTMKNPLARSPLQRSWAGISVKKVSDTVVQFILPSPYAPFPHALTFGLVPKHLLNDTPPESLRESAFNREPVGSGAFVFNRLQVIDPDQDRVVVYMNANKKFVRGEPKLDRFQLHVYKDTDQIKKAFLTKEINAAADLTSSEIQEIKSVRTDVKDPNVSIFDGTYALFRTNSTYLTDVKVREALRLATDRTALINKLGDNGRELNGPLLGAQFASLQTLKQPGFDLDAAGKKLDEAGWVLQNGKRIKDGQPLTLTVVSLKTGDYPTILETLSANWEKLGITINKQLADPDSVQQNVLLPRAYDVFIYELAIGVDPDVYSYWHSGESINLSNYNSVIADEALESAQSRSETQLRQPKYETFVKTWLQDVPAVALFQPSLHYITSDSVSALTQGSTVPDSVGRYRSIELWTVQKDVFNKTP